MQFLRIAFGIRFKEYNFFNSGGYNMLSADVAWKRSATEHFICFPPETEIRRVFAQFRTVAKNADVVMYIYVIGTDKKLLGVIDVKELLRADPSERLADHMTTNVVTLTTESTIKEASKLFARYSFRAIPIVDEKDAIVGVIPYRDVMDLKHRYV